MNEKDLFAEEIAVRYVEQTIPNAQVRFASIVGSRGQGMESDKSGWDVKIIYAYKKKDYLHRPFTGLTEMIRADQGTVEIEAWDLVKFLRLMKKTNPQTIDWMRTPLTREDEYIGFQHDCLVLQNSYWSPNTLFKHAHNMAWKYQRIIIVDHKHTYKNYAIVIYNTLYYLWVLNEKSIPPNEIQYLLDSYQNYAPDGIIDMLDRVIRQRTKDPLAEGNEDGMLEWSDQLLKANRNVDMVRNAIPTEHLTKLFDRWTYD